MLQADGLAGTSHAGVHAVQAVVDRHHDTRDEEDAGEGRVIFHNGTDVFQAIGGFFPDGVDEVARLAGDTGCSRRPLVDFHSDGDLLFFLGGELGFAFCAHVFS